jgi:hypothetical protein
VRRLALVLAASLLQASALLQASPRIVYTKAFPGSAPPWAQIAVERDGKAVYREAPDDEQPIKFALTQEDTDAIFALAEKLNHFKDPLESGLKVANMGTKTLRWDDGGKGQEVSFNYSQNEDCRAIHDWFEKMNETQQIYIAVERTVKYDKLGANKALLQLQALMEKNRFSGGLHFLPLLERVVKNETYLNMARDRASMLIDWIKDPKLRPQQ